MSESEGDSEFEKQTVQVGSQHYDSNTGAPTKCTYREVEFRGKKIQHLKVNRGVNDAGKDRTLYEIPEDEGPEDRGEDEKYIVHTYSWSKWQGTSSKEKLHGPMNAKEVSDEFPELANKAGIEVPAKLDEVL